MGGGHTLKTWSTTQSTISLSSGEAELYVMTKCAAQLIGIMQLGEDFGFNLRGQVYTDSTAALGITHREGLGRTRHVRCQYLWIQEKTKDGTFGVDKVRTDLNPADLMTKNLTKAEIVQILEHLNHVHAEGRSDHAPKLVPIHEEAEDEGEGEEQQKKKSG